MYRLLPERSVLLVAGEEAEHKYLASPSRCWLMRFLRTGRQAMLKMMEKLPEEHVQGKTRAQLRSTRVRCTRDPRGQARALVEGGDGPHLGRDGHALLRVPLGSSVESGQKRHHRLSKSSEGLTRCFGSRAARHMMRLRRSRLPATLVLGAAGSMPPTSTPWHRRESNAQ